MHLVLLSPKTTHASLFTVHVARKVSFPSVRKYIILESDRTPKSQANWNPARILVKIFWLISAH
jgi:hypothetical protein